MRKLACRSNFFVVCATLVATIVAMLRQMEEQSGTKKDDMEKLVESNIVITRRS